MGVTQKTRFLADRLRELTRLGFQMPPEYRSVQTLVPTITVEQAESDIFCAIVDLSDGRALYLIWLSLVATVPGTRLDFYRIEPPWPDSNFEPLPSFEESHVGEYYKLPGGLEFHREEILNFNFSKPGWRLPGNRVEGLLCAVSTTPIPDEFMHGATIPVAVRFFDRTGQQLAVATVDLWADRLTHRQQPAKRLAAKARGAESKTGSAPPSSSAVAAPGRSSPSSPRRGSGLWEPRVPENGTAATTVRAYAYRALSPRNEMKPNEHAHDGKPIEGPSENLRVRGRRLIEEGKSH